MGSCCQRRGATRAERAAARAGGRDRPAAGPCRAGPSGRLRGQRWQAERGVLGWLRRWAGADWAGVWQLGPGWFSI